jgi:methylglutamate dehydrogenase subunit B
MRIECPFCGLRDYSEFVYRGDACAVAAVSDEEPQRAFEAVYLRDNPAGSLEELWYHAYGCRRWLRVLRDTRNHQIHSASFAGRGWDA